MTRTYRTDAGIGQPDEPQSDKRNPPMTPIAQISRSGIAVDRPGASLFLRRTAGTDQKLRSYSSGLTHPQMTPMAADRCRARVWPLEFVVHPGFSNHFENELGENGCRIKAALKNLRPSAQSADCFCLIEGSQVQDDGDELARSRAAWRNRGVVRPRFAIEPGPGQESVWDYPRPPVIVPDDRMVRVLLGDIVIAETARAYRVLETASPPTFYLPAADVRVELLVPGRGASHCEWKGAATYWSLFAGDVVVENVGWSYGEPYREFEAIRGYYSFYPARVECTVGDDRVAPQPGGFYGGWVTPEIVGPFKGEAGTQGW